MGAPEHFEGAVLTTDFDISISGHPMTGGEPWTVNATVPTTAEVFEMARLMTAAGDDQSARLAAIESTVLKHTGDPQGFARPTTWSEIKTANDSWYYGILSQIFSTLQEMTGAAVEVERKNL